MALVNMHGHLIQVKINGYNALAKNKIIILKALLIHIMFIYNAKLKDFVSM